MIIIGVENFSYKDKCSSVPIHSIPFLEILLSMSNKNLGLFVHGRKYRSQECLELRQEVSFLQSLLIVGLVSELLQLCFFFRLLLK